jgi:hypothetical protein
VTQGTKGQDRRVGRISYRAAWIALPLGLLNVALASLALLFAGLNGYSLILLLEDYILPGAILAVSVSVVGALVASHRPRNPLGWIFLAVGFFQGLVQFAWTYAEYALITEPDSLPGGPLMSWLGGVAWIPSVSLFLTFALLLFPDGRLPSPRWRPVAWLSVVPLAIFVVDMAWLWPYRGRTLIERPGQVVPDGLIGVLLNMLFPLMVLCGLACVISLMVRFWYSHGVERQQIKWFAYAAAIFLTANVGLEYLYFGPIMFLMVLPIVPVVPVALGVAILRYRLYDIDVIINRTLVYGSLTATLALIYFGGVVGLQYVFRALTAQGSTLAVVASTLAIAALFNPLRRRVQGFVDRRFYRRKYDAAKTLAAFNTRLREEADLDALRDDVVEVVRATMQPAHVSLWLREPNRDTGRRA